MANTPLKRSRSSSETIKHPASIVRLFEQLSRRYTPLTVQIVGYDNVFTSCALDVIKPYLLLDELMPSSGHPLLVREGVVNITGKLDGIEISFQTSLHHVDQKNKLLTYNMHLPEKIEYRQRRQDYRVNIPMSKQLRVLVDNENDHEPEIAGELHDLSNGGAGIIFSETDIALEPGHLYECAIEIPGEEYLFCCVELRYTREIRTGKQKLTGVLFLNLTPVQARLIGRFISEMEREQIKKRALE